MELSGADEVNLFGYCFGGDLALLHAAHHDAALRSLTVLATPVDFRHMGPLADIFSVGGVDVGSVLGPDWNVPPSVVVQGFRSLTPTAQVRRYVTLWERLWPSSPTWASAARRCCATTSATAAASCGI